MPDVTIEIGGRTFKVACQRGQESFLKSAAQMMDTEAQALSGQVGRLPESQMLLMAGLMLADRVAGSDERLRLAEEKLRAREARIEELENRPPLTAEPVEVERVVEKEVEVVREVVPQTALAQLRRIAENAEAVAGRLADAAE